MNLLPLPGVARLLAALRGAVAGTQPEREPVTLLARLTGGLAGIRANWVNTLRYRLRRAEWALGGSLRDPALLAVPGVRGRGRGRFRRSSPEIKPRGQAL